MQNSKLHINNLKLFQFSSFVYPVKSHITLIMNTHYHHEPERAPRFRDPLANFWSRLTPQPTSTAQIAFNWGHVAWIVWMLYQWIFNFPPVIRRFLLSPATLVSLLEFKLNWQALNMHNKIVLEHFTDIHQHSLSLSVQRWCFECLFFYFQEEKWTFWNRNGGVEDSLWTSSC